jgi:putative membrane protein
MRKYAWFYPADEYCLLFGTFIIHSNKNVYMRIIINFLITAVFVYILSKLLEPHVVIYSFTTAIIFSIVLALLNAFVKPIIIILTLPLTIITLGLFLLVINVIIILLADKFVSGIKIDGFLWAFIFGLLLSIVSSITHKLKRKWTL